MRSLNLLAILAVLFISVTGFAQEREYSHYDIDIHFDPEARLISGSQEINYYNDTGETLDEVLFLLNANGGREPNPYLDASFIDANYPEGFDPSWTIIHSVSDEAGQALDYMMDSIPPFFQTFSLDETLLRVKLPQSLAPGGRVKLNLEFETKFPHASNIDSIFYKNVFVWRFAWNPVAIPQSMLDNRQLILENANYQVRISLPEELVLATGAERQTLESVSEDGIKTILLESDGPVRSVGLVISEDFEVYTLNHGVATIDSYYLPGNESQARLAATYAANQLDYYVKHFGEYGYLRLAIVDVPSPGTYGMAVDGMILLGTDNYILKDLMVPGVADRVLEWLVAHEVGHLWWGIGVGTDFNAENWLSEGFAQYLSITYFEDHHDPFGPNMLDHLGEGVLEDFIRGEFGFYNLRQHNVELSYLNVFQNRFDEPIITKSEDVEYGATVLLTYQKGYLVNRALEGILGKDTMFEVLRTMYERYNHEVASVDLLQQVAEEVSGQDLDYFFNSWLYGDDFIDVAVNQFVSRETDTKGFETDVQLIKRGQARYPVTVRVTTEDGETVDQTWEADSEEGTLTFSTATPVVSVAVDPMEMMPDVDRFNNFEPRKIEVSYGGDPDFPLDAYSIRITNTGIQGLFGLKHQWSVNLIPRFEAALEAEEADEDQDSDHDEDADEASFHLLNGDDDHDHDEEENERLLGDNRLYLDGVAVFNMFLDRGLTAGGVLTMTGLDVEATHPDPDFDGNLGLNLTLFEQPQLGQPGKTWVPANIFRFSVGMLGKLSDPIGYVGVDFTRSDQIKLNMVNQLSVRAGFHNDNPFVRGSWNGTKRTRIMHNTYLDTAITLGSGLDSLPERMRFSLNELQGFTESFSGDIKAFGRLALALPPRRDINFSLLNLALLENLTLSGFVQGGDIWHYDEAIDFSDPKVEAGLQLQIDLSLPVGIPLSLSVGYAYPIMGAEEDAMGQVFFSL